MLGFSFKIHTASTTVSSGPIFKKIDTVTIGNYRIQTKIINMIKTMWPNPKMIVTQSSNSNGAHKDSLSDCFFVRTIAIGVRKMTHTRPSIVINKNGDTSGSSLFKSLINAKFAAKHKVETSMLNAANTGLNFVISKSSTSWVSFLLF